MSENTAVASPSRPSKKDIRKSIQEKLTVTLADYRTMLGDKKFESRIRKAARRLGGDIASAIPRKRNKKNNKEAVPAA